MNKILMNWHSKGIRTPEDVERDKENYRKKNSTASKSSASYDIDEFNHRGEALPVYRKGE